MVLLRFTSFPVAETTSVLIVYSSCVTILSKNRTLRRQHPGNGLPFHPCPRCNQTDLHLRQLRLTARLLQQRKPTKYPSASFGLVSSFFSPGQHPLLFFPNTWPMFTSLRSDHPTPSQVSDIFIPREMSKQKEERIDLMMVHKKVAFRSFIVPQEINPVVLSHYLASERSFF